MIDKRFVDYLKDRYEIILGSASEGRKEIFERIFKDFRVIVSDLDEERVSNQLGSYKDNPIMLSMFLAYMKNLGIQSKIKNLDKFLLITFDTVVVHGYEIKQKPLTKDIAKEWFRKYKNDFQEIISSYAIYISDVDILINGYDKSIVFFKDISDEDIDNYILSNPVQKWSGGIAIERLPHFFEIIEGNIDCIIGAPMDRILKDIEKVIMMIN